MSCKILVWTWFIFPWTVSSFNLNQCLSSYSSMKSIRFFKNVLVLPHTASTTFGMVSFQLMGQQCGCVSRQFPMNHSTDRISLSLFLTRKIFSSSSVTSSSSSFNILKRTTPINKERRRLLLLQNQKQQYATCTRLGSKTTILDQQEQIRYESENEMQKIVELYQTTSFDTSTNDHTINNKLIQVPICLQTRTDVVQYLKDNQIDTFLFDCDGVLYRSPNPLPGARECITSLLQAQKRVYFITNNASTNRKQLCQKLTQILQLTTTSTVTTTTTAPTQPKLEEEVVLTEDMMITSSYSCAMCLKQLDVTGTVYVIGSEGLCDEIRTETNCTVIRAGACTTEASGSMSREELSSISSSNSNDIDLTQTIDAVVVGHDTSYNFRKLCIATLYLQKNPNAFFIATNQDSYDIVSDKHTNERYHIPGNGALVASIEYASKRKAINVGKPSYTLIDLIQSKICPTFDKKRSIIIGDRLDTDICFGQRNDIPSILVLTGVTTYETLQQIHEKQQQQYKYGMTIQPYDDNDNDDEALPTVIVPHVGVIQYS